MRASTHGPGSESGQPVITIAGLCSDSGSKVTSPDCKTVVTAAQFEKVVNAVQPGMAKRGRKEFAERYADALVLARKAEEMGLDKEPNYEEQLKLARIQILSQDMKRVIQEKASQISDKEIEDYYHDNAAKFEKAEVDRIYIPRIQQVSLPSGNTLTDAEREKHSEISEQAMRDEAATLHRRAVAGDEFAGLQADAYQVAEIKSAAPGTAMTIRRISLPPGQVSVMDLKPGEVSSVFTDSNGYFIFKIKSKETVPLSQVREEIRATLRAQHIEEAMHDIEESATSTLNDKYFAP